jgi:hypothetical protein
MPTDIKSLLALPLPDELNRLQEGGTHSFHRSQIECGVAHTILHFVGDVTIPTHVIEYNQNMLQADQPITITLTLFQKDTIGRHIYVVLGHTFLQESESDIVKMQDCMSNTQRKPPTCRQVIDKLHHIMLYRVHLATRDSNAQL